MPSPFFRFSLIGAALCFSLSAMAAAPPMDPNAPKAPDAADDPLPPGAIVRFGTTRPILKNSPGVALLAPKYTNFLAPTMIGGVRRYDLGTGRPLEKRGLVGTGQVVASADGKRAAVACAGIVTVVDVATGDQILAVTPPEGLIIVGIPGISLSADGKVLAYSCRGKDGKGWVVVCGVDKNEQMCQVETVHPAPVHSTLSRDGKTLVTHGPPLPPPAIVTPKNQARPNQPAPVAAADTDVGRTAQVWDVATGDEKFKARVTGMAGMVSAAAFSPSGRIMAISAGDGPVDLFDVTTGERLNTLLGRKMQGAKVAFSPDGKIIASTGPDYRVQRWAIDGKPLGVSDPPPGLFAAQITGMEFMDNERVVTWMTHNQFAFAWEDSGKLLSPVMDHAAGIRSISFVDDGRDLYTSGLETRNYRWDLATGRLLETIDLQPARIPGQPFLRPVVALSADARWAVANQAPTEVFDMANGRDQFVIPAPSAPPSTVTVRWSPDGTKVIVLSRQPNSKRTGACVIWDLVTQHRIAEFDIPPSTGAQTQSAVLSPDSTRLVLATVQNLLGRATLSIAAFDTETGIKLTQVQTSVLSGSLNLAAADDKNVVVASTTGRLWVIDYAAGRVGEDIDELPIRAEAATTAPLVFSPDGKRFAVGVVGDAAESYGVRVYDWPKRKALHTFIGHIGPLTAIQFSKDGKSLATGAQDTSVLLWDLTKLPKPK
jgi:WD40 repeat protein